MIAGIDEPDKSGWRISAERLERAFADAIATRMNDADFAIMLAVEPTAVEVDQIGRSAKEVVNGLKGEGRNDLLAQLVAGGSISPDALAVELNVEAVSSLLKIPAARIDTSRLAIVMPWSIRRRGVETSFVIGGAKRENDRNLIARISLGNRWFGEIKTGASISGIASREGVTRQRVGQVLKLAFLSPVLIDDAINGRQPSDLTVDRIIKAPHLELWANQQVWASRL